MPVSAAHVSERAHCFVHKIRCLTTKSDLFLVWRESSQWCGPAPLWFPGSGLLHSGGSSPSFAWLVWPAHCPSGGPCQKTDRVPVTRHLNHHNYPPFSQHIGSSCHWGTSRHRFHIEWYNSHLMGHLRSSGICSMYHTGGILRYYLVVYISNYTEMSSDLKLLNIILSATNWTNCLILYLICIVNNYLLFY